MFIEMTRRSALVVAFATAAFTVTAHEAAQAAEPTAASGAASAPTRTYAVVSFDLLNRRSVATGMTGMLVE